MPGPAEFILGDSIARTLNWILEDALKENTDEAWEAAYQQAKGVDRLLMMAFNHERGNPDDHATMAMLNFLRLVMRGRDNLDQRYELQVIYQSLKMKYPYREW